MTALHRLYFAYGVAARHLRVFLLLHVAIRAVSAAILTPLAGALLALGLAASGQPALSDQAIAMFFTTPAGIVAGLAIASLAVATAVLDLALMTAVLRGGRGGVMAAVTAAIRAIALRFRVLVTFGLRFTLRVLLLVAPWLVTIALVAVALLGRYDINYYLAVRPPVFLVAVTLMGSLAAAGAVVLVQRLAGWALALHLAMIADRPVRGSFAESAALLAGRRQGLTLDIALWAASRLGMSALAALTAGLLMNALAAVLGDALGLLAAAALVTLALWWLLDTALVALANGALAVRLHDLYVAETGDAPSPAPLPATRPRAAIPLAAVVAGAALIAVGAVLGADAVIAQADETRPVAIIAHRGAAATRPENTLAAIEAAAAARADWVEIDVQETADGGVVVAHDSDFMKQAGNPLKVWNATLADLAGIDIGSGFDPAFADQRPPTLAAALETVRDRSRLLIELKYYGHAVALERRVAEIVEAAGMADRVAVMSLKYSGVRAFAGLRPTWPRGVLSARAIGDLTRLDADFVAVNAGQVSVGLIRRAHGAGKLVYVWTVNDPLAMSRLASMGVDGVITDDPALARQTLAARAALSGPERLALWIADRFRLGRFDLAVEEAGA